MIITIIIIFILITFDLVGVCLWKNNHFHFLDGYCYWCEWFGVSERFPSFENNNFWVKNWCNGLRKYVNGKLEQCCERWCCSCLWYLRKRKQRTMVEEKRNFTLVRIVRTPVTSLITIGGTKIRLEKICRAQWCHRALINSLTGGPDKNNINTNHVTGCVVRIHLTKVNYIRGKNKMNKLIG